MHEIKILLICVSVQFANSFHAEVADYQNQVQSCTLGDKLKNDCTDCVCVAGGYYNCTAHGCDTNNNKKYTEPQLDEHLNQRECHANTVYMLNTTVCICTKGSKWPHENCRELFKSLPNETPEERCEPNTFVIVDCNVCRCGPNGTILKDRCTKNTCSKTNARRFDHLTKVYGSCDPKNWYSLAPCQFCYCVDENKLVCNKATNLAERVQLGTFSLNVCGKKFMAEALELLPGNAKEISINRNNHIDPIRPKSPTMTTREPSDIAEVNGEDSDFDKEYNNPKNYLRENVDEPRSFTHMPFAEQGDAKDKEIYEPQADSYSSSENDGGVEIAVPQTVKPGALTNNVDQLMKNMPAHLETPNTFQKITESLKINIPSVLDQVLRMALRKSMLSLSSSKKCEPGSTSADKCNTCYCLKNGKLLCTKNVCNK